LERYLEPDEAIVDTGSNKIFILEKKFQTCGGSADEKIQTGLFKYEYYVELYPTYTIKYAYVLNNWFKNSRYLPEMRFLKKYDITVLWGEDTDYFDNLCDWLLN
jgi:hypothetical protein